MDGILCKIVQIVLHKRQKMFYSAVLFLLLISCPTVLSNFRGPKGPTGFAALGQRRRVLLPVPVYCTKTKIWAVSAADFVQYSIKIRALTRRPSVVSESDCKLQLPCIPFVQTFNASCSSPSSETLHNVAILLNLHRFLPVAVYATLFIRDKLHIQALSFPGRVSLSKRTHTF